MRLRVRFHYRSAWQARLLIGVPLFVSLLFVSLTWCELGNPVGLVAAPSASGSEFRQYYLTLGQYQGNQVNAACAPGYHFASIWEITDPSALRYNTGLGLVADDSGMGPPTAIGETLIIHALGWVRTGYTASVSEPPGQANCYGWISDGPAGKGTMAFLPTNWTAGNQDVGMWEVEIGTCNSVRRVWCVEDGPLFADGFESGDTSRWS